MSIYLPGEALGFDLRSYHYIWSVCDKVMAGSTNFQIRAKKKNSESLSVISHIALFSK